MCTDDSNYVDSLLKISISSKCSLMNHKILLGTNLIQGSSNHLQVQFIISDGGRGGRFGGGRGCSSCMLFCW